MTSDTFPQRMKAKREQSGLSYEKLARRANEYDPTATIGRVRNLESPKAQEDRVSPVLLWALAKVYDCDLAELSPIAADAMSVVVSLERSGQNWKILNGSDGEPGFERKIA